ncbi:MAG: hypothetical protein MI807_02955 [Verrucomicrobiales bacterium]|nr:hypothetical protein [Verrucomicrobiales bacterium]
MFDKEMHELNPVQQSRRIAAKIDDAVVSLEAAEFLMQGRIQSSLWWGRIYSLRLRAIAASELLNRLSGEKSPNRVVSFALRRRHDYLASIRELFSKAKLLCHGDTYRLLRTIDYSMRAIKAMMGVLGVELEGEGDGKYLKTLNKERERLFDHIGESWLHLRRIQKTEGENWCDEIANYINDLEGAWQFDRFFKETKSKKRK